MQDRSCHNSENWLQRNGNKRTLKLKINCTNLSDNQDDAGQITEDQMKMTVTDNYAVSACNPPPSQLCL